MNTKAPCSDSARVLRSMTITLTSTAIARTASMLRRTRYRRLAGAGGAAWSDGADVAAPVPVPAGASTPSVKAAGPRA
jgi:hypothetical protein